MSTQGNIFFSTTHINRISNCVTEKFLGIFTKIDISFSSGIGITKFLAHWKTCYEGCVMTGSRDFFSTVSSSCDIQKGMVHSAGFLL